MANAPRQVLFAVQQDCGSGSTHETKTPPSALLGCLPPAASHGGLTVAGVKSFNAAHQSRRDELRGVASPNYVEGPTHEHGYEQRPVIRRRVHGSPRSVIPKRNIMWLTWRVSIELLWGLSRHWRSCCRCAKSRHPQPVDAVEPRRQAQQHAQRARVISQTRHKKDLFD
jgi:hypothetical protein